MSSTSSSSSSSSGASTEDHKLTEARRANTTFNDVVVTKYKMAAEITNMVLRQVLAKVKPGASVREICKWADGQILAETEKHFKKDKKLRKGIAFPTCISVNNCIANFSPLNSDSDYLLKDGDVAKVDLGCHIDEFVALGAHTIVVGFDPAGTGANGSDEGSGTGKITGRKADVLLAAHYAAEAALRLIKPGNTSTQVTKAVSDIAGIFLCKPIEGAVSHQLVKYAENDVDHEPDKVLIFNPNENQKLDHENEEVTFEVDEAYEVDILLSTGEGVGRLSDTRSSIYKRTGTTYMLKLKASRGFYREVLEKHGTMAFNLRDFGNETRARMGVNECVKHEIIVPHEVAYEKPNEIVAQFKFTVLLLKTGSHKITGLPFDPSTCESAYEIDDEGIKALLAKSVNGPKLSKKKKVARATAKATGALKAKLAECGDGSDDKKA